MAKSKSLRAGTGPGRGRYSGTSSRGRLPPQQQQQGGRGGSGRSLYHDQPKDVEYVASLKGHTAGITALTYDSSSAQVVAVTSCFNLGKKGQSQCAHASAVMPHTPLNLQGR